MRQRLKKIFDRIKYRKLKKIYSFYDNVEESNWIISFDDCIALYKIIKKYKIKNVLELGTGIGASTLLLAHSLPKDGRIDTVDQIEKCIKIAKRVIPENYKNKITFHWSEAEIFEPFKYINTIAFKELPKGDWDLILIDGPSFLLEDNKLITSLPRGDIFRLMEKIKDGVIIYIDGNPLTVKLLKRFYSDSIFVENGVIQKVSSNKPQDAKFKSLKSYGFFPGL